MKKKWLLLLSVMALWLCVIAGVSAETVVPTDVSTPSEGCVFLGIEGKYLAQQQAALDRINEIRMEACREGVRSPRTGKPLTAADYVPIKWSSDLEYIARIRAAESGLTRAHTRTNGKDCFEISSPRGVSSYGEVLAWNWSESMVYGINQWYREKSDWINQTGAVTGHYTQMIDPRNTYVGLATFCSDAALYYNTTAGEFTSASGLDQAMGKGISDCVQMLEVKREYVSGYTVSATSNAGKGGDKAKMKLTASTKLSSGLLRIPGTVTWSSSNASIAAVDANGTVTAKYCGSATITAMTPGGDKASVQYTVNHTETADPAVAATCTKTGLTAGSHCSVCGTVTRKQTVTAKLAHKEVTDPAVAATCTKTG